MVHACMQVVRQVGERVAALHDAGWVHRNLKPGNVLWMPSCNSWRLVDCASCAISGVLQTRFLQASFYCV